MSRYKVCQSPDQTVWTILDRHMWGFCALPVQNEEGETELLPLEWRSQAAAEAWLQKCYIAWQRGVVPAPRGWRPLPPYINTLVVPNSEPASPGS